ncbi:hypothetical protein T05_280, partial [Trichinella murrelli]
LTWIISPMISAYFKDNISLPVWLHGIHSACTGHIATAQHATYATHFYFLCTTEISLMLVILSSFSIIMRFTSATTSCRTEYTFYKFIHSGWDE